MDVVEEFNTMDEDKADAMLVATILEGDFPEDCSRCRELGGNPEECPIKEGMEKLYAAAVRAGLVETR